ncbi:MAG: glycine cleavage T C-terminal barrel domain-containing protein [Anaerolineales bacterium]
MTTSNNSVIMHMNPRVRKSPFFDATRRHGAKVFSVYNHMFIPQGFEDFEIEYWSLIKDVTLWDVGVEQPVEITGPDAFAFTNHLTPRDLSKCKVGQGKYVLITTREGGIINDPVLSRLGENHFWLAPADSDLILWVMGVAVNSGMDVQIRRAEAWPLQVQGPKSREVMESLFGSQILDIPYYHFMETSLKGIPVVVARTGWTAELGYEIYLRDETRAAELWEMAMEAGRPHKIRPTGPSHIRRIEAGILNYQIDMTLDTNPFEVGLDRLVELNKPGDFVGRQALERIKANGVKRKLVGVEIDGDRLASNEHRWPVSLNGTRVGWVSSSVYSPRLEKNIGYAMVPIEQASLGSTLTLETPVGVRNITVVHKPFVDPKKDIPKK